VEVKKIGLLTLPLIDNYGGIIQLTALNHYLQSQGYETVHLNKRYKISSFKAFVRVVLKWNPLFKLFDFKNHARKDRYITHLNSFISREFPTATSSIYTSKELSEKVNQLNLDAVIVGSDQVWRMLYIKDNYKDYFLSFVDSERTKKIAYAASFGLDVWEQPDVVSVVKILLKDFTSVGVREDTAVGICENTFDIRKVNHVLDPTFLPELKYYDSIIEKEYSTKKDIRLFNYVLDKSVQKEKIINEVSGYFQLDVDSIYLENNIEQLKKIKTFKPSMGEWLYHFKNANFIITDSFHGTVFSIIFNKQFLTIGNKARGLTRFTSLLKALGLLDRLIVEGNENYDEIVKVKIDYNTVNEKLADLRALSKAFLKHSLS